MRGGNRHLPRAPGDRQASGVHRTSKLILPEGGAARPIRGREFPEPSEGTRAVAPTCRFRGWLVNLFLAITLTGCAGTCACRLAARCEENLRAQRVHSILTGIRDRQIELKRRTDRYAGSVAKLGMPMLKDSGLSARLVSYSVGGRPAFVAEVCDSRRCMSIDEAGNIRAAVELVPLNGRGNDVEGPGGLEEVRP